MDKMRYGIIGIGKMGSLHCLRFKGKLIKGGALTSVCDISPERREWAEKNFPKVKFFEDYKEMMESGLVDAVLIATPHYLHPEIAKAALSRDLHTLIEKPAGVFTSAIRELNEFAKEKKDLVFGIMYNQRTNKLYRYAKMLVDSGRLGEMKRINWIITNWYRPQA
ncbi:MAG: Gfo/Idh/MocA family oxidoreductase [Clostridia bacterium]|nr:Gfo/Idh/MocA family oxidoreductase [Clostridia bacterium]